MSENIVPLRFDVEQVGKHVKGSKKRFIWEVSLNHKAHSIILDFSFISGKVKVTVDRRVLLENELPSNTSFQYPFTLDGNSLNVIQQGDNFELRINNKVFSHLYNQMKTNKEFKSYNDEIKDIKVNESHFQAKKMTLNIGGVGTGMKKKPKNEGFESHNWDAFGASEDSGFPNYFGSGQTEQKVEQKQPMAAKKQQNLLDDEQPQTQQNQSQSSSQSRGLFDLVSDSQSQPRQHPQAVSQNENDFNTMQNMFSTMNLQQETNSASNQPKQEVNFFDDDNSPPTSNQTVQNSSQPSTSLPSSSGHPVNDFNTMQNMFATGLHAMGEHHSNSQPSLHATNSGGGSGKASGLDGFDWGEGNGSSNSKQQNTVQSAQKGQQQQNFHIPPPNSNDFSTMQNLFATNMGNVMGVIPQNSQTANVQSITAQSQQAKVEVNTNDFSTMQNLFQTNSGGQAVNQQQSQQWSNVSVNATSHGNSGSNGNFDMAFMNTHSGGNSNGQFNFENSSSQFATTSNTANMVEKPTTTQSNESNDLL